MKAVIGGKRYDTEKGVELASDRYWDGHNYERHGRNAYLYRGSKGAYFVHHTTMWQGELDTIEPLDEQAAIELYESLPEKDLDFEDAFPGRVAEEA